jgi:histidinol-phosphatase
LTAPPGPTQTRSVTEPRAAITDPRFTVAWQAADEADRISLRARRERDYRTWTKPDGSPATDVDTGIERMLAREISRAFPADTILGEELHHSGDDDRWIIDPLDGTASFLEGLPLYAHMICYRRAGSTLFSLVSAPALGARWWAYRGAGAFKGSTRLAVSRVSRLAEAKIGYGGLRDYADLAPAFVSLVVACRRARGLGNFLPHMLVAEGVYDIASSARGCSEWDVAPLSLVLQEAGGRLSGFDGRAWSADDHLLTSNGLLHDEALARIGG